MKIDNRFRWYAHRLRAMTAMEVLHRVAEARRHATNDAYVQRLTAFVLGPPAEAPRLPAAADAPAGLLQQLALDARAITSGKWRLFGWRTVDAGTPPCWHRDAVCGVVIDPALPSRHLNHRSLPDGADARTIWEINRWTEITRLAMHGWLNRDETALRTAQEWLQDWLERNPPGRGINWTSPLEVALRLINFTWFDALLRKAVSSGVAEQLLPQQEFLAQCIVPIHAAWVWRFRSAGSSANNHLLGELAALVIAVKRWPSLADIACTAEAAWDSLGREILKQFAVDGGSHEQALHYHLFAFDLSWNAALAIGCHSGPVYERLRAAAGYWASLAAVQEPWDFGDSDDAQVLPLTLCPSHAAAEWRAWLLGEENALCFWLGSPPPTVPTGPGWCLHQDSGMACLRQHDWMLRLDASPLGFGSLAAHGHCDALHLSLWDKEHALFIDPGTGGYYGHPELRAELAAWSAHNGPQPISGFRTPLRLGPFLQAQPHERAELRRHGNDVTARLRHENHCFERTVSASPDAITITDRETWGLPFRTRWFVAPECQIEPAEGGGYLIARKEGKWRLSINGAGLHCLLETARVSRAYSGQETTTVLNLTAAGLGAVLRLERLS